MKIPALALCLSLAAATLVAAPPNIVLMMADDLGAGDLSCYGSPQLQTPHLDQLAADGARFTDFYAASAVCSPSRGALLTGRFSVRAGIYSWIHASQKMHLHEKEITIAELLKEAGYATAHAGKWHLGYDLETGSGPGPNPGDHGFDHWLATGNNAAPSHANPKNFVRNGQALGEIGGYSCQIVADEAIQWLESGRDPAKPFFLNVWFHEPHQRVAAPEELNQRHQDTSLPAYYGCIENMDQAAGRLLAKLEAMGVAKDTLVIFTSDNGSYRADRANNRNLKGRKTSLWEGGIRVVSIFRWPGVVQPGSAPAQPAGLVDILPTLCEAAGIDPPAGRTLDGTSLLPLFRGQAFERAKPLYWFYNPSRPVCVIRDGDYCLIADPEIDLPRQNMFKEAFIGDIKKTALINHRLFNLRDDPGQENDLSEAQPERLRKMVAAMETLHRDVMEEAIDWREFSWDSHR